MKGDIRALYRDHATPNLDPERTAVEVRLATMFDRLDGVTLWPDGFPEGGFACELIAAALARGERIIPSR